MKLMENHRDSTKRSDPTCGKLPGRRRMVQKEPGMALQSQQGRKDINKLVFESTTVHSARLPLPTLEREHIL